MLEEKQEAAKKQAADAEAQAHKKAATYHRAFVQNEAGKAVLDDWVMRYCMSPIKGDPSSFQCGKVEGRREMIQEILLNIKRVQEG